jgi:hypothetical protein
MSRMRVLLIAALFLIGFSAALLSEVNMQEGSWEMTIETEMKGMPFKIPPVKYSVCLSKSNVNPQKSDDTCKIVSSKLQGSTYTWVAECQTKDGNMKSDGSITYRGATMDGYINVVSKGMQMKQKMSGRRTGVCQK